MVGGFLGAGKTTLLKETARRLAGQGKRISLITNDQAGGLVDTSFLKIDNDSVLEVSGSCFCCNFNGLLEAVGQARQKGQAEIIIAEPVGSCTDLSATILQPLKDKYGDEYELAPLTVLIDPQKLQSLLAGDNAGLHGSSAYILKKQLEEADVIAINKKDLLKTGKLADLMSETTENYPQASVFSMIALDGDNVGSWLSYVLSANASGQNIAEVDYDIYAEGEAVLGWLNATMTVSGPETNWNLFGKTLLRSLGENFDCEKVPVGHAKLMVRAGDEYLIGNLTGKLDTLKIRGNIESTGQIELILNIRFEMSPEQLKVLVREEVDKALGKSLKGSQMILKCLSPGRPNPTFRYQKVV